MTLKDQSASWFAEMVRQALALATSDRLLMRSNHVSICSGLAAIFSGKFRAISGRISETVKDRVKVTINH